MKKLRTGDLVISREEHDYLGVKANAAGNIVKTTLNEDGTQEITVNFDNSARNEVIMDSSEVKFIARNPTWFKAFQVDIRDVIITEDDNGVLNREKVREFAYVEAYEEIVIITKAGYLNLSPTDPIMLDV